MQPGKLNYEARFPVSAWRADFFAQIAVAEFAKTNWQSIAVDPPPVDPKDIFKEIEYLIGPALDMRAKLAEEILDQDVRLAAYFAQVLMLSPSAHPNTIKILEMAVNVGLMVAMHFKFIFKRGRPQQVFPGLVPLVPSPWHASYPSGHSLQSHLTALGLGEVMPGAKNALVALARRIGENREVAGVHFQSDTVAGRNIAEAVFPRLMQCAIFAEVLEAARGEHSQ